MNHTRPKRKAAKAGTRNAWLPGICRGVELKGSHVATAASKQPSGERVSFYRDSMGWVASSHPPASSLNQESGWRPPSPSNPPVSTPQSTPTTQLREGTNSLTQLLGGCWDPNSGLYFQTHSQTIQAALKLHTDLRLTLKSVLTLLLLPPKHRTG